MSGFRSWMLGSVAALALATLGGHEAKAQGWAISTPGFGLAVGTGPGVYDVSHGGRGHGCGHGNGCRRSGCVDPFRPPAMGFGYPSYGYGPGWGGYGPGWGGYGYGRGCVPVIPPCHRCGGRHHRGAGCGGHGLGYHNQGFGHGPGPGYGYRPW